MGQVRPPAGVLVAELELLGPGPFFISLRSFRGSLLGVFVVFGGKKRYYEHMEQRKETKKFLIIDSNSVLHRAFHALPPLKTKKGEVVNAVYGFLLIFFRALKELQPDFVIAAFDIKGPTFRHREFKEYKIQRPKAPDELYQQIEKTKEVMKVFKVPIFEKPGFEADDVIGTIADKILKKQVLPPPEIFILSGDLDALQLVNPQTKVWTMKKGIKETALYGAGEVRERYGGLAPSQLTEVKGLRGDPSDNIPGVPGVGEKTAVRLIKDFGSLENLYEKVANNDSRLPGKLKEKLKRYKEQAFLSRQLCKIKKNIPIDFRLEDCRFGNFSKEKLLVLFKELEFYSLIKRLEEVGARPGEEKGDIEQLYRAGVLSRKVYELEKKLTPVVKEMEKIGIKADPRCFAELGKSLEEDTKALKQKIFQKAGREFNPNSSQQVSEVLFHKLNIAPKGLKKTPGGVVSTSSPELRKIKAAHPIIGLILKYRELFKMKSGFVDSLSKTINSQDKRIHPHFNQLGAETGRMSCSEPNLQNIPTRGELGRDIRRCFIPEAGFEFLSADYSQIELRIAASFSADEKMTELFKKGKDVHKFTAEAIFQLKEDEVGEKERELAKTLNFGLIYGMGPRAIAERAGISFEEAQEFQQKYFATFPALAEFREGLIGEVREKGFTETIFGRKRFLQEINSIDPRLRAQAERMAVNAKIQGSNADIIKLAMVKIKEKGVIDNDCRLLLQIHDELLFEIRKEKTKEKASAIKKIMEDVVKLRVPLRVEIKTGKNWGELVK